MNQGCAHCRTVFKDISDGMGVGVCRLSEILGEFFGCEPFVKKVIEVDSYPMPRKSFGQITFVLLALRPSIHCLYGRTEEGEGEKSPAVFIDPI